MQLKEHKVKPRVKPKKLPSNESDDLILKRKGGGSIIDHRPLFSNDGETLYVVWKQVIRAYSATTGDFVKELEPADHKIVDIVISPENADTIIGCTDNAELVQWNCHNGLITTKTKLEFPKKSKIKIKSFHTIYYTTTQNKEVCNGLVSSIKVKGDHVTFRLELFDLKLGTKTLSKDIENFSEEYYIDIIGNHGDNLIAVAHDTFMYILSPKHGLKYNRHKIGRKATCIAGHPEDECVALGDVTGRVVVLKDILQTQTVKGTYHWHTLPVTEIAFTKSGGHMYTGGGECVLVKWLLANPQNKSFLPRLPAPIRHLVVAPENIYIAVSTLDNGIMVVNPQRKLTAVVQNFTWGVASTQQSLFPAGLSIDPRTNSLVLNSRTGHVQFFNPRTKSLLYNVNITAQNILTQERDRIIVNTEVTRAALSSDGIWMATMEERDDGESDIEIRLKFWEYIADKQNFVLNTSVELPHEKGVNALKFRSKTFGDEEQFVITVGKDEKFKVWHLVETSTLEGPRKNWRCYSVGYYSHLPALDAEFSSDGSLVGVSFGSTLTLWSTETCALKSCLSHSRYPQSITRVEFGKHSNECIHLVVAASTEHMAIWDLLSLTMKWSVPINLAILTSDPFSDYMAAFTTDNTLFVFTPANHEPVYVRRNLVEKDTSVLAACFLPNPVDIEEDSVKWQKRAQLYFLDSEQELLTLETKSESSKALENLSASRRNAPLSAFNRLVAAERITNVEKSSVVHDYIKGTSKNLVEKLLTVPAHTLPPMRMMCMPFILSLMDTSAKDSKAKSNRSVTYVDKEQSDSEDEDDKKMVIVNCNGKHSNDESDGKEESTGLLNLDWSFLSAVLPSNDSVS